MTIPELKQQQCKLTLFEYVRMHAQENSNKSYFITEDKTWTYGEAYAIINGLAKQFSEKGIKKGSIVALRATRSPQTVMLIAALGALGALTALTDAHVSVQSAIQACGVDIEPEFYITNEEQSKDLAEREGWVLISKNGKDAISFEKGEELPNLPVSKAEDPFVIIFTSGSTGKAKAVVLSHKNCIANPVDAMPLFQQDSKDRAISLLPLDHVFGLAVTICATFCGHDVFFPAQLGFDYVLKCLQDYQISVIYSVPSFFMGLLRDNAHKAYNLEHLRLGLVAGAPFTVDQLKHIEGELGMRLMPGYGMSECVGVTTMRYEDTPEDRTTGVGKLYPMTELKTTANGEICVRGATLMLGYYNDEKATREVMDEDGWLHTGDLGYMDERGFLHVIGRIKDIIIRNGNNLSSVAIEQKLMKLDCIKDVCVVGVKDEKDGEVPAALIVLNDGMQLDEKQLSAVLTKIETPKHIKFAKAIPLTSSGKPDKQTIRKLF